MLDLRRWKVFQKLDLIFISNISQVFPVGHLAGSHPGHNAPAITPAAVFVMKNDDVYGLAGTTWGLQFLRVTENLTNVRLGNPIKMNSLCGKRIKEVVSGRSHVVALTEEGKVYNWVVSVGEHSSDEPNAPVLVQIPSGYQVTAISSGLNHTLALTSQGSVFAWGCNRFGQLGTGTDFRFDMRRVQRIPFISHPKEVKITSISCGDVTSYAIDTDGQVWSWGSIWSEALGYYTHTFQDTPTVVQALRQERIVKIGAGKTHVLALTEKGDVYYWGDPGFNRHASIAPKLVSSGIHSMLVVRASSSVNALEDDAGVVYYWGRWHTQFHADKVATGYSTMKDLFFSLQAPLLPIQINPSGVVMSKLYAVFDDPNTADIKFLTEGRKIIHAHRTILLIRSDHFRRMFDNNWTESDDGCIQVPEEFRFQHFRTFLQYLYTDVVAPVPESAADAVELIRIADYYGEERLRRDCEEKLSKLITQETFPTIYSFAVLHHGCQDLKKIVLDYIMSNLNDLVNSPGYKEMSRDLKDQLIAELAEEGVVIGLKRKRAPSPVDHKRSAVD